MKIKAIPFLVGTWGYSLFSHNYEFSIAATLILVLLVITKQIDLV